MGGLNSTGRRFDANDALALPVRDINVQVEIERRVISELPKNSWSHLLEAGICRTALERRGDEEPSLGTGAG